MKKKIAIGACILAVLLVAGGLWYTRPRAFWEVTGMDRDQITGASGYAIESFYENGRPEQQVWEIEGLSPRQLPGQTQQPDRPIFRQPARLGAVGDAELCRGR